MGEEDSREDGDEAYDDEVSEEQSDTSQRGRYASPRKMPCKSNVFRWFHRFDVSNHRLVPIKCSNLAHKPTILDQNLQVGIFPPFVSPRHKTEMKLP